MTCDSKKHIEEALARIRVQNAEDSKEEEEVKSRLRRKERKKITA